MNDRTKNVKRNIIYSFLLKFLSVGLSFVLLPLTVHYLTEVEYGIWVTLFTVMNWVNFLDMGLGLGLRNKLAEAVSKNNLSEIRTYLSTGIFAMISMGSILLIVFLIGSQLVNMQSVFNTEKISEQDLYVSTLFTGIFVIIAFVLSVINQIYYAYQKAAVTGAIQIVHNLIMLGVVYYLTLQPTHKLFYFVLSFGIAVLSSRIIFIIDFFNKNKSVIPKIKYVKIKQLKNITSLGIKFFIIQIACIVIFSSSNILITQCLGPEHVRSYDIVFKIFSIITMGYGLIVTPLWSAYTDAYVKRDFLWIKMIIKKMIYLMLPIIIISFVLVWKIDFIIELWFKMKIELPQYLVICMAIYVIVYCWNNIWTMFLNGIGVMNLQLYLSILNVIIILPLSWYFMGQIASTGMILAITIGSFLVGIPQMIQVLYLLNKMLKSK
ncbi:oligosaccharide flippase family protein [Megamonas funiformis]|uniref:oligosaccharide flippase family protein n=1 Tax=Megamonas funiformis TaxID=437897 RepID=UPI00265D3ECF|nr:oligosaccharide flippase family protein [Megamonas funiformis]